MHGIFDEYLDGLKAGKSALDLGCVLQQWIN